MMPSKIMFIRHGEKPEEEPPPHGVDLHGIQDKKSLSVRGWMRAGALVVLFAPPNGKFQDDLLATPDVIYATGTAGGKDSSRMQQTIIPLLEKLGEDAEADISFDKGQEHEMIASALNKDGVVLICWEHDRLTHAARQVPLTAKSRAAVPETWDDGRFDMVWVFERDADGDGYVFSQVPQMVLAGDSTKPMA